MALNYLRPSKAPLPVISNGPQAGDILKISHIRSK